MNPNVDVSQQEVTQNLLQVDFPPRKKIGVTFRRHNEWGIVKVGPPEGSITVGSVLCAVNGKNVLLSKFDDAIGLAAQALTSGDPFQLTFRTAYSYECELKKWEKGRLRSGWKTYHMVLQGGVLQCFSDKTHKK